MITVSLENITSTHIFHNVSGHKQVWRKKEKYSFIGSPRKNHGFMYVKCDEITFRFKDDEKQTFYKGDLLYIPKRAEYEAEFNDAPDRVSDILVNFTISDIKGSEYCLYDRITKLLSFPPPGLVNDMVTICEYLKNMKNPYLLVTKTFYSLLEKITSALILELTEKQQEKTIAPALLYIDNHINDNIQVTTLAKMCLMSETAFRKAFKQHTGLSPAKYKMTLKVHKAQELLSGSPNVSVAEVAESLGFYDLSYFYKTFTAITGTTPNKYRTT